MYIYVLDNFMYVRMYNRYGKFFMRSPSPVYIDWLLR